MIKAIIKWGRKVSTAGESSSRHPVVGQEATLKLGQTNNNWHTLKTSSVNLLVKPVDADERARRKRFGWVLCAVRQGIKKIGRAGLEVVGYQSQLLSRRLEQNDSYGCKCDYELLSGLGFDAHASTIL